MSSILHLGPFYSLSLLSANKEPRAGIFGHPSPEASSLPHGPVVWTYRLTSIDELQFQEPFEWPFPVFHVHPGSLILQMGKQQRPISGFFSFSLILSLDDSSCAFFMLR